MADDVLLNKAASIERCVARARRSQVRRLCSMAMFCSACRVLA